MNYYAVKGDMRMLRADIESFLEDEDNASFSIALTTQLGISILALEGALRMVEAQEDLELEDDE